MMINIGFVHNKPRLIKFTVFIKKSTEKNHSLLAHTGVLKFYLNLKKKFLLEYNQSLRRGRNLI